MTYIAPRPTTHQEVFDIVATHLSTQNARSTSGDGCVYRSNTGLMCAAGCLLDDSEVTDDNNGQSWYWVYPERLAFARSLVEYLQEVHDHYAPAEWPDSLRDVAAEHNLSAAVVDQLSPPV